ncbi:hypothetical protein [Novosphingobium sp. B 225]|nr:hypothetical protein [Novosphingobium sp. B 225]
MTQTYRPIAALFAAVAMLTLWVPTLSEPAAHSPAVLATSLA